MKMAIGLLFDLMMKPLIFYVSLLTNYYTLLKHMCFSIFSKYLANRTILCICMQEVGLIYYTLLTHCNIIFFKKTLKDLYNAFLASMEPADAFELNLIWTRSPPQVLKTICRLVKHLVLMVRGRLLQRQRRALNLYTHTWFVLESSDRFSAFISNFGLILN